MRIDRLKDLRTSKKLTQAEMADKLKIARTTYAAYEQGKREPDDDTKLKIANYFDVTVDYLLGKNQTPKWANEKDANDLAQFLQANEGSMTYQGENLTEEEKEKLEIAMTQIFWKRHKHD